MKLFGDDNEHDNPENETRRTDECALPNPATVIKEGDSLSIAFWKCPLIRIIAETRLVGDGYHELLESFHLPALGVKGQSREDAGIVAELAGRVARGTLFEGEQSANWIPDRVLERELSALDFSTVTLSIQRISYNACVRMASAKWHAFAYCPLHRIEPAATGYCIPEAVLDTPGALHQFQNYIARSHMRYLQMLYEVPPTAVDRVSKVEPNAPEFAEYTTLVRNTLQTCVATYAIVSATHRELRDFIRQFGSATTQPVELRAVAVGLAELMQERYPLIYSDVRFRTDASGRVSAAVFD